MSNGNNSSEELDLKAVLEFITNTFKKTLVLLFRAFQFVLKFWIVILVLIIIGAVWGYFADENKSNYKQAGLIVQINNSNVNYTYNAIEKLDGKIKDRDSLFLESHGFDKGRNELKGILITPIVNINNLIDKYDEITNRSLDVFVDVVPFDEEVEKLLESAAFLEEYKYHKMEIITGTGGEPEVADKIISYLNSNELIAELGKIYYDNTKNRIESNNLTINQLNGVIESFTKDRPAINTVPSQFIVERNINIERVFEAKIELQDENEVLQTELLKRKESIVLISNTELVDVRKFTDGRKKFLYPFALVSLFLFLAFIRYIYMQVKRIADADEGQ